MRGIIVRVAQIAVTLTVGLAILASLAVWRLSQGPVSLNFLTSALERTFSVKDTPFAVLVDDTSLVWGGWRRVADLRVHNMRVYGPDGKLMALLPEVSIGLSLRGLLRGDLAVSRLDILGLRARVERLSDGRFDFEVAVQPGGDEEVYERSPASLLQDALRPIRDRTGPYKYLRRFSVIAAKLLYVDKKAGNVWNLPNAEMVMEFDRDGVDTNLALVLDVGNKRTELVGTIIHDRRSGRTGGRIDFNSLAPGLIARAIPDLSHLATIRTPVSGAVNFEFGAHWTLLGLDMRLRSRVGNASVALRYPPTDGPTKVVIQLDKVRLSKLARTMPALATLAGMEVPVSGKITGTAVSAQIFRLVALDLTSGAGRVELPGLLPQPVTLSKARIAVDVADDQSSLAIRELSFDFGGPAVSLTGIVERTPEIYRLRADTKLVGLRMGALDSYWPLGAGESARRWVTTNIVDGTVSDANASIVMTAPLDDPWAPTLKSIEGKLEYQDLSISYWDPLPKVIGVDGTASFDRTRFDFAVTNGRVEDVAIEQAVININGLDQDDQDIAIDIGLRGPAQTIAKILDRKPLAYISLFGLEPKAISGDAITRTTFRFPLMTDLSLKQIQFSSTATLRKLGIASTPYGFAASDGDLKLTVTNKGLDTVGSVKLSSVPVVVDWRENFTANATPRRRLILSGRVPDLGRVGFNVPAVEFVKGPADMHVVLTGNSDGTTELLVGAELADASFSLPQLGWKKPAGVPGTANVLLALNQGEMIAVEQFSVEAEKSRLLGSARPREASRETWRITLDRFENDGNDLRGRIDLDPDGSLAIDVSGTRFDVGPLMEEIARIEATKSADEPRRVRVSGQFGELRWGPDRRLSAANILVRHSGEHTQALVLNGRLGDRSVLRIKYMPGPDGQILRVSADDFGEVLSMSPSHSRVSGGTLLIRGIRQSPDAPLSGTFLASRFRVSRAPVLARVLQVASLSGIVDALSRKGLAFDAFEGDFLYRDGRITLSKASAHGSSVGVTVNGVVDFNDDTATLGGTLVPAYSLNRAIGQIPVIGSLLTGGAKEGVFAATYRAVGSLEDPKVTVNPLSALAPGFLRNLFGLGARQQADRPAPVKP